MIILESIIVAVVLLAALIYLVRTFWPRNKGGGCGCSNVDCKVPKPKIKRDK